MYRLPFNPTWEDNNKGGKTLVDVGMGFHTGEYSQRYQSSEYIAFYGAMCLGTNFESHEEAQSAILRAISYATYGSENMHVADK